VVRGLRIGDGNSRMIINCHRPDNSAAVKNDIEPAEGAVYRWIWTVWVEPQLRQLSSNQFYLDMDALHYGEPTLEELTSILR
jgi:hypothetical protein